MRRGLLVLLLAGITAAAWSAVGSQAGTKHSSSGSSVTIANVAGMSWTCGFNPFNSTVQFLSFGPIYEELVFVNALKSGAPTPWLASKFKWSNHAKTLTFTIRKGAKWSDGKPLTAGDVLFTFQLLKKHKALDLQAVWSVLKSVSRKGRQGRLQVQVLGGAVLLLRRRPDADRAEARLVQDLQPGEVPGQDPGRQWSLHG